ncbi:MAG TPA: alcohol dehydrogenase catalytic domain-containing protein [Syntrophales bacterium]|nr:alcohol dehydrogenase catalytic domain-containing protein [Syntrophales bacterium]HOM06588.1 alcohol dehydrogenase catalytic domain-containing protein [Syntrophales bacterium]HON99629.1 alcohol dehydrogenase catalytic domain-containing protein [Syntrophales bacterium]HPC00700.1 alcohol dehydrogenase catalytic domain-containing protein [Syntrophales bacterium]HPQ06150.1 alcohol dehydrogenase catalytic domain-containing protein [Syntrophales bacterium]
MRVAVYYHNEDVRVEERPVPAIGPGEMLVRVMASGICGSDVMEWYRRRKAPVVLGHEIAGDVVEVGAGVEAYREGQRVFVSHHIPCNTCRLCLRGCHTACETLHTTNYDPGGFAEYLRVPALNVDRGVFPLPEGMSYEEGVFIEPLACVVRGQRLAGFQPGWSVLVLGSGISGMLHILLARAQGAGLIMATDVNPFRLSLAEGLGGAVVRAAGGDTAAWVREVNGGRLADLVVVCAGVLSAFEEALRCVERGGVVLCFATTGPDEKLSVPLNEFWRNEIKLMPSYGNAPLDAVVAMDLIRHRRVDVLPLITHRLPLERIQEGFRLVAGGGPSLKVVIEPHGRPDS